MNAVQKKFILEKLVPFVLREQGRGFGMSSWRSEFAASNETGYWDGVFRQVPKCNTVACIGGSVEVLNGFTRGSLFHGNRVQEILGISAHQAEGLFYNWQEERSDHGYGWPLSFVRRYKRAKTTLGKARIVVSLLKEVVKTGGKCLNPPKGWRLEEEDA